MKRPEISYIHTNINVCLNIRITKYHTISYVSIILMSITEHKYLHDKQKRL